MDWEEIAIQVIREYILSYYKRLNRFKDVETVMEYWAVSQTRATLSGIVPESLLDSIALDVANERFG